ncbi:MAG: hypothetical protein LBT50_10835 [Prevotellaceae bacterium]|nr:hypothetical protein [Prevotellaceae bacterium]
MLNKKPVIFQLQVIDIMISISVFPFMQIKISLETLTDYNIIRIFDVIFIVDV